MKVALVAVATAVLAAAAACGGSADRDAAPAAAAGTTAEAPRPAFPVTIGHQFGTTEITAEPRRVLTLGFSEQDPVLALGVVPVAVRDWFGEQPHAVWPWAQDELGVGEPEMLTMPYGELAYETIAAQRLDLIVATHSGITAEEYERLAQIAPTLAQPGDYPAFGVPWQVASAEQRQAIEENPLYRKLRAAREGRSLFFVGLDDPVYGALSFSTVLSLPFALERLVPVLAAAVDGDPETQP